MAFLRIGCLVSVFHIQIRLLRVIIYRNERGEGCASIPKCSCARFLPMSVWYHLSNCYLPPSEFVGHLLLNCCKGLAQFQV